MRNQFKLLVIAALAAFFAVSAEAAVRVWSQVNGVWSTRPEDTPFTGRSFNDNDIVIFTDPENLSQDKITAYVTVHGVVIPQSITFTNEVTMYITTNGTIDASIGINEKVGRVQFINKYGLAPVTVDTPICFKNVVVADGVLTLNNMNSLARSVHIMPNATFNFRYNGDLDERVFVSYNLEENSTWHRYGTSRFQTLDFPTEGSFYAEGSRTLFDRLEVTKQMKVFSPNVYVGATEYADIRLLEVWNGATFVVNGRDIPDETNKIGRIDVLCDGVVNLLHGNYLVGVLTTNSEVAVRVAAGATDRGRLIVGGDRDDPVPTRFKYETPPGIVYTENDFVGNTIAELPGVTVGGVTNVNSYMFVTNGATVNIKGKVIFGGGDVTERIRRVFVGDGAEMTIDGILDFSELTNYAGKADARMMVSNATLRVDGIDFGPKDIENKIRQVIVKDGAVLELGAHNSEVNIAATNSPKGGATNQLGNNYAGTKDQHRSFIIDGGTLKFTADQRFNQTIFLQEGKTNVIDLAGHTVSNCASVNPYYAGASEPYYSGAGGWVCNRLEIRDSSPEQNGFLYIDSPHWSVRNGLADKAPATPPGYIRKQYGTQLMSGRFRMRTDPVKGGEDCGFSLRGGILEIPVGKDYPAFVKTNIVDLCHATDALACIWDSEVGAIIRCYCSDESKLVKRYETNTWQLVCEVIGSNTAATKDGIAIDEFMRNTTFQLIDEHTGKMLPGATFVVWPLRRMWHDSVYEKYEADMAAYTAYTKELAKWTAYTNYVAEVERWTAYTNYLAEVEKYEKEERPDLPEEVAAAAEPGEEVAAVDEPTVVAKPAALGGNLWWYDQNNPTQVNRFAILMRYEDDIAEVSDLYWDGKSGDDCTLSDGNKDDWYTPDGVPHRYGDGVNIYITNVAERLTMSVDRSTGIHVEEIVMGEDGLPVVIDGVVQTNLHALAYTGQKPASPNTVNVIDCSEVVFDAQDSVLTTYGVFVSNSVVEINGHLVLDGGITVVGDGAILTATQLVHRSSWYVGPGATFYAGYNDPEVTFSTMSHTITNYGKITYTLNGTTERITQPLSYPEDAKDEDTCYYTFENGTIEFDGADYLVRRANTNVWISENCVRHIVGTEGKAVVATASESPMGYQKGGMLKVDIPYIASRGSVLRSQASFELNNTFTFVPGSTVSVVEHQEGWDGPIIIQGTGAIGFQDNVNGKSFADTPFRFYTAVGETNRVEVPMTGEGEIVVEGGGTLFLADKPSTVSGKLRIKAPSVLVVEGPESLGYLDVTVEPGAFINFKATGYPQRYCRSITMMEGSVIALGPNSSTIEPMSPIRILELGTLTMSRTGVYAITQYDSSTLTAEELETYGISNSVSRTNGDITLRFYDKARSFQGQYVELFGLMGELIWDLGTDEGEWFSRKSNAAVTDAARWHEASGDDPLNGYATGAEFVNFENAQRNSVTFMNPATVTVNNLKYADEDYPGTEVENRLLPSGILFATAPGTAVAPDSPAGGTMAGESGAEIKIIGSADASVIGSAENLTAVYSTRGAKAEVTVPIWLQNLTVNDRSYLRIRNMMNAPELTVLEHGSRLAVGTYRSNMRWSTDRFRGDGYFEKFGDKNVVFDVTGDTDFPNPIGLLEGELKLESDDQSPTLFTGGLTLSRYENALSQTMLTLYNTGGRFGWVFDGSAANYNIKVDDDAVFCGRTFGLRGKVDMRIAAGKTMHIESPLSVYFGDVTNDEITAFTVTGEGTIRFSNYLGQSEYSTVRKAYMNATFSPTNRVELNNQHICARNMYLNGTLAVMQNGDSVHPIEDVVTEVNDIDKLFRIDFVDYTNDEVLVDFPMPVKLSAQRIPMEPVDVLAFDENGKPIACEFDSYSNVGADAGLLVWAKVPRLHKGGYIFVGCSFSKKFTDLPDPKSVWSDYIAVWHMNVNAVTNDDKSVKWVMPESAHGWHTEFYAYGNKLQMTEESFAQWQQFGGPLGNGFHFNDVPKGTTGNNYNGFLVTNEMIKFMANLPEAERKGLTMEGFFDYEEDLSGVSKSYKKILSYRFPSANGYALGWFAATAGPEWGSQIAYLTDNANKDGTLFAQIPNASTMDTQITAETGYFFAGAMLTDEMLDTDKGVGQWLFQGSEAKYFSTYTSGGDATVRQKSITYTDKIYDVSQASDWQTSVGIGFRPDGGDNNSNASAQRWRGRMTELRVRKGTLAHPMVWMDTVRRSAMENKLFTSVCDVSASQRNLVRATEAVVFGKGSTIEIQPGCVDDKSLVIDLSPLHDEEKTQPQLITSTTDASITIDLTPLGLLGEEGSATNGTTLITVRGDVPVNIFTFKLKVAKENTKPEEWALRSVGYKMDDEGYSGTYIQLVKAQGAVMVLSPAESGDVWPEGEIAWTRNFAPSGTDFAVIPKNFNAGLDLTQGAVIRDTYEDETDGVTEELLNHLAEHTRNVDYWFGFKGDNGAWSKSSNYTLNLRDEEGVDDNTQCHVQFAVTNQIFYGQATDTLNAGELGFYVSWDVGEGGEGGETNLVARVLNTNQKVKFPLAGINDPWLVVSVEAKPYYGYNIVFNGQTNTISTMFAGRPKALRVTGIATVDNIYVSNGDPLREMLVYIHDMTRCGVDEKGVPNKWIDQPIEVSEFYYNRITTKAKVAGFEYQAPRKKQGAQPLCVAFRCRMRRGGLIYDSDVMGTPLSLDTGSDHLDRIDLLHLSTTCSANDKRTVWSESLGKNVDVYKYHYEYALGIATAKRHANNAVTIYSVLSDSAESYGHLLGSAEEPHVLNGYLFIESTDTSRPYNDTNTHWKPVSVSALPQFGENALNETFVAAPTIHSNLTYRVRVQREYPLHRTTSDSSSAPGETEPSSDGE